MAPAHRCAGPQCVLLPHRGIELTLWIALSVSAGIGYLQRQFMGMTKSAPAGILLAAATFGAAHAHQGLPDDDSDRAVRSYVRDPGLLARNRPPWNDSPCVAGFIQRSAHYCNEALESA